MHWSSILLFAAQLSAVLAGIACIVVALKHCSTPLFYGLYGLLVILALGLVGNGSYYDRLMLILVILSTMLVGMKVSHFDGLRQFA